MEDAGLVPKRPLTATGALLPALGTGNLLG